MDKINKPNIYNVSPNCLYPKCPFYCSKESKFINLSLTPEEEDVVRIRMRKSTIIDILLKYNWIDKWKSENSNEYEYCDGCDIGFSKVNQLQKGETINNDLTLLFRDACDEVL